MNVESMLSGLRVLDLADEKGWYCAKLLADMGAEVIRVDPPGCPAAEVYASAGKLSLSLDIEKPGGKDILLKLAAKSDVLIESYPPGRLRSLELDYPLMRQISPGLILASITPFGQSSSDPLRKSSELTAGASGGQLFLNGQPGKPPLKLPGPQAYLTAALFAANGVLLALRRRRSSGFGQHIDISIQECAAGALDHALVRFFSSGEVAQRQGQLYWNNSYRLFRCRQGWVGISFLGNWETLIEWLDSEGMAADLAEIPWRDPDQREKHLAHIIEIIEKWALSHDADELVELSQLMRLPWAKVATLEEVLNSPQLRDRAYFVDARDSQTGLQYRFPGPPLKMSASPWQVNSHFARLGEHNSQILGELLGLTSSEIEKLEREGVI